LAFQASTNTSKQRATSALDDEAVKNSLAPGDNVHNGTAKSTTTIGVYNEDEDKEEEAYRSHPLEDLAVNRSVPDTNSGIHDGFNFDFEQMTIDPSRLSALPKQDVELRDVNYSQPRSIMKGRNDRSNARAQQHLRPSFASPTLPQPTEPSFNDANTLKSPNSPDILPNAQSKSKITDSDGLHPMALPSLSIITNPWMATIPKQSSASNPNTAVTTSSRMTMKTMNLKSARPMTPTMTPYERLHKRDAFRAKIKSNFTDIKSRRAELQIRARIAQGRLNSHDKIMDVPRQGTGRIVKMEKMLLRVDLAIGDEIAKTDFSEKDSRSLETRVVEKWREFIVVCRETEMEHAPLALQMYHSRTIPAGYESKTKHKYKHEIPLERHKIKVNLYSALDKTIAICVPDHNKNTRIYYLRSRSATISVDWFHFFQYVIGLRRAQTIQIDIPALGTSVRLDNPFDKPLEGDDLRKAAEGDEEALAKSARSEQVAAQSLIHRCLQVLSTGEEWKDVLQEWANHDHIGLAWRRYDRLEWVHGEHGRKMYGANAMLKTHDLELRAKDHYPGRNIDRSGKVVIEPAPVEGFLLRLTSRTGQHQRLGRYFYKRQYFTTQNQYLITLKPQRSRPPAPPEVLSIETSDVPSAEQVAEKIPLIFTVNPYPLENGQIKWLSSDEGSITHSMKQDNKAVDEAQRNIDALHNCDGFINLCDVVQVREYRDDSQIQLNGHGKKKKALSTETSDEDFTFELLLKNDLVIRLQAYDTVTKTEWIKRLSDLVVYWKNRTAADMELFKMNRQQNLDALNIDERGEAYFGQFAHKWEVIRSFACSDLYNLCGLTSCRAIHNSGILFRKPHIHTTFTRCHVLLVHGQMLIFEDVMRTMTGQRTASIRHDRVKTIDLKNCYMYAGLSTENDLLYQHSPFNATNPGSKALPRMFLEDHWTSIDEDAMCTFVLWQSRKKGWHLHKHVQDMEDDDLEDDVEEEELEIEIEDNATSKSSKNNASQAPVVTQTLKRVNRLGKQGRSIVFKARSRAERDHWVLSISTEIERVSKDDAITVVDDDDLW